MKDIKNKIIEYNLPIRIAAAIILIGIILIIFIFNRNIKVKEYNNKYYSFNYDSTWKISKKSNSKIKLKNSSKATLNIDIISIEDEYKYSDITDIIDEITYDINKQNKGYKLISKKQDKVTKNEFNGYKLLYESDSSQAMIIVTKTGENILIFNYESSNKYFDIILDSAQNIIYNFSIKPKKIELTHKISLDTEKITFSKNDKLVKKLNKSKTYEIASNNYLVNYSIPSIFKPYDFDSVYGSYIYDDGKNTMTFATQILPTNIYDEVLDDKKGVKSTYNYIKKDKKNYKNIKEKLSKFNIGKYKGYIYKITYTYEFLSKENVEAYIIVLPLNKNHIFTIRIEGKNIKVPEELINKIKINNIKNYSSYIHRKVDKGNISAELKRFSKDDKSEFDSIKLSVPDKYRELDNSNNMYKKRVYGLNHDQDNDEYQYEIEYELFSTYSELKDVIKGENDDIDFYKKHGNYTYLISIGSNNFNGKDYSIYEGSYYKNKRLYNNGNKYTKFKVYRKVLINKLKNGGYLKIRIDGNNTDVKNSMFKDLTNIKIEKKKYE